VQKPCRQDKGYVGNLNGQLAEIRSASVKESTNMSSLQTTVDFILEQISAAGNVSARKMFGEFGVYCDGKIVALICNDQLFVKPTSSGRAFLGEVVEAPPYEGAKPSLLIDNNRWDDAEWMTELIRLTAQDLPAPKAKKPKK
jgi:TfoX/Sxy family transcriptional regulator of competence genes